MAVIAPISDVVVIVDVLLAAELNVSGSVPLLKDGAYADGIAVR